jgi:hypothetical protein
VLSELARWLSNEDDFAFRSCLQSIVGNRQLESLGRPKTGVRKWQEDILGRVSQLWDAAEKESGTLFEALSSSAQGTRLEPVLASVEQLRAASNAPPHDLLAVAAKVLGPWCDAPSLMAEATEWVDDCRSRDRAAGRPAARVLSMWQAKGLEADLVFVVGLEEGAFPDERNAEISLEEQYRMLYVSMTRAKQKLYLYYAQKRSGRRSYRRSPGGEYAPPQPAQFLDWLPDDAVDRDPLWLGKSPSRKQHPASAGE